MTKFPKTPSFRLDNRRALIVGASRGIGLGAAAALAEAGAHVTLAARSEQNLLEAASAFQAEGFTADIMVLDVAEVKASQAIIEQAIARDGPFDILVNNAGLARNGHVFKTKLEDFDAVLNVNLRGIYFITQCVSKEMAAHEVAGSIITISSQMGHVGGQERAVYAASKHALEGMTKSLAIDLGPYGIRANTIAPTFIKTELTKPTFDDPQKVAWIKSKLKLGRFCEIEDIMGAVVFLASDAAAMMTGASLIIDGGWTAG